MTRLAAWVWGLLSDFVPEDTDNNCQFCFELYHFIVLFSKNTNQGKFYFIQKITVEHIYMKTVDTQCYNKPEKGL